MNHPTIAARLLQEYPAIAALDPALREAVIARELRWLDVPAGARLFDEGRPCPGFPLVVSGEVRVERGSTAGRALELYRVQRGELCVASTAGIAASRPMQAQGVASQASELALLTPAGFER